MGSAKRTRRFCGTVALHEVPSLRHRFGAGRDETAAGRNIESRRPLAVHVADVLEDADLVVLAHLHQHDARAVPEEYGGRPVGRIHDTRHAIRAADEYAAGRAALHQLGRGHQRVHEAGARAGEVEAPRVDRAELGL